MDDLREAIARAALDNAGIVPNDGESDDWVTDEALYEDFDTVTWDIANRHTRAIGYAMADAVLAVLRERGALRSEPDLSAMLRELAEQCGVVRLSHEHGDDHAWRARVRPFRDIDGAVGLGDTPEGALAAAREAGR